ncbi:MAG: glycosyltransferase family 4 protein [Bacteroidetes bacterium]|nr:glycosyltransferase family 4 protein [Bacteroidota bacterium]
MEKETGKILILADAQSNHTYKWVTALAAQGYDICVFSLTQATEKLYEKTGRVKLVYHPVSKRTFQKSSSNVLKIRYLTSVFRLYKTIFQFKPDIVHAHYASSYGLLGALSGFQPLLISVWGSDVYEFPGISLLHRRILKFNLKKARFIFATSQTLASETKKYTCKPVEIIPFGINTETFKPFEAKSPFGDEAIVIGTIKSLEDIYGTEYLIKAFHILKHKYPELPLRLLITGGGSTEQKLKTLVKELHLEPAVIFTGRIAFDELQKYHNMITIFAALSLSESFGVAVLEASACGKPVVVTNVGGLPEVVKENVTGFLVPPADENKAAEAIEKLILDRGLREEFGKNGSKWVKSAFSWSENVQQMVGFYKRIILEK